MNDVVSFWADEANLDRSQPLPPRVLESPLETDLLVVGAGFAGLSTALEAARAEPRRRVVLVESQRVGFGASGRNAGMVSPMLAVSWLLDGSLPADETRWTVLEIERRRLTLFREFSDLDGGPREATTYVCAPSVFAAETLSWLERRMQGFGMDVRLCDSATTQSRIGEQCRSSLAVPSHAIHPARFCWALQRLANRAGVEIYEHTRIERLEPTDRCIEVFTDAGVRISAQRVVLTVGAWCSENPIPTPGQTLQTYMLATPPLSSAQLASLGTEGETALVVRLSSGFNYRRTWQARLLFGGLDDVVDAPLPAGFIPDDVVPRLRKQLTHCLPQLSDLPVERVWGGPFHVGSLDLRPTLEHWSKDSRVILHSGSNGAGVAWCLLVGSLLRGMAYPDWNSPSDQRLRDNIRDTRIPVLSALGAGAEITSGALAHLSL